MFASAEKWSFDSTEKIFSALQMKQMHQGSVISRGLFSLNGSYQELR